MLSVSSRPGQILSFTPPLIVKPERTSFGRLTLIASDWIWNHRDMSFKQVKMAYRFGYHIIGSRNLTQYTGRTCRTVDCFTCFHRLVSFDSYPLVFVIFPKYIFFRYMMILARKIRRKGKFFSNYTSSQQEFSIANRFPTGPRFTY